MVDDKELKDQRVVTMMSPSELEAIDDWMFGHRIRSRGDAIRRLTAAGLALDKNANDLLQNIVRDMDKVDELIRSHEDFFSSLSKGEEITSAQAMNLALASMNIAGEFEKIAWSTLSRTADLLTGSLEHIRYEPPPRVALRDRLANLLATVRRTIDRKQ